jgi:LPS-assembly lipoprotein
MLIRIPTMQRRLASFTLLLGIACLLAACGFQLRGTGGASAALPDSWKKMYLVTNNPNSEFTQAVRTVFTTNNIVWTAQNDANYLLNLGPERFSKTNLSLNKEARVSQLELTMQSTFSVVGANGEEAMPNTVSSVIRRMDNDPRNELGMGEEIRILKSEMHTELAQQIVRRIGFFAAKNP